MSPSDSPESGVASDHDVYDRQRRRILWTLPTGLYLLGSSTADRRNLMTVSWVTQVSSEPKLVGVGVERESLTYDLVSSSRRFAVSILRREDRALVRKFVKPAVEDAGGALNGFDLLDQSVTGAPVLAQAAAWLACGLRHDFSLGSHNLLVGEVKACGFVQEEDFDVLRMEDTRMSYGG